MTESAIHERGARDNRPAGNDVAAAVSTLRGATVRVDPRRLRRALTLLVVLSLVGLVAALFVAGARKNVQVTELRNHGVPVTVTVTGCLGLMGGSGSNVAGYTCRGTYSLRGRSYNEVLPGSTLFQPGFRLLAIAVPGDPALIAPSAMVAGERASWRVFLVPVAIVAVLALGGLALWRRSAGAKRQED